MFYSRAHEWPTYFSKKQYCDTALLYPAPLASPMPMLAPSTDAAYRRTSVAICITLIIDMSRRGKSGVLTQMWDDGGGRKGDDSFTLLSGWFLYGVRCGQSVWSMPKLLYDDADRMKLHRNSTRRERTASTDERQGVPQCSQAYIYKKNVKAHIDWKDNEEFSLCGQGYKARTWKREPLRCSIGPGQLPHLSDPRPSATVTDCYYPRPMR